MNRDFVYHHEDRPTAWSRAGSTINKWLWGALCCGMPGIPCYFCRCCEKMDDAADRDRPTINRMSHIYYNIAKEIAWSRAASRCDQQVVVGALCCGMPGIPCYFYRCCEKMDHVADLDRPKVNRMSHIYYNIAKEIAWSRAASRYDQQVVVGALCCGMPGIPCYFCRCCEKMDDAADRDRPTINQATATAERMSRPHRPHAPRGRKSTPEMLSAVRCALSQLQGEPAPPVPPTASNSAHDSPEPGTLLKGERSTLQMLSAVRCALSQLQGEPAPPVLQTASQSEHDSTKPG